MPPLGETYAGHSGSIAYYDFAHPDATNLLLIAKGATNEIQDIQLGIPSDITIWLVSAAGKFTDWWIDGIGQPAFGNPAYRFYAVAPGTADVVGVRCRSGCSSPPMGIVIYILYSPTP